MAKSKTKTKKQAKSQPKKKAKAKKAVPKKKAAQPVKAAKKTGRKSSAAAAPAAKPRKKIPLPPPPPLKGVAQPLVPIITDTPVRQEAPVATGQPAAAAKSQLRAAQVEEIRQLLLRRREDLLTEIREELKQTSGGAKPRSADPTDQASDSADGDLALALAQSGSDELTQIDAALAKAEAGELGVCEECGGGIPIDRLRVLPHAVTCIDCKRRQELQRGSEGMEEAWEAVSDSEEEQDTEEE